MTAISKRYSGSSHCRRRKRYNLPCNYQDLLLPIAMVVSLSLSLSLCLCLCLSLSLISALPLVHIATVDRDRQVNHSPRQRALLP